MICNFPLDKCVAISIMSVEHARQLVTFLQETAPDHLRSVIYFEGQTLEIVYLRNDLEDKYAERDHEVVVESHLADVSRRDKTEDLYVHGWLNCKVKFFDNVLELLFPHGHLSGTAVTLDFEAAGDLGELVPAILEKTTYAAEGREARDDETG